MTLARAFLLSAAAGFAGVVGLALFDKWSSRGQDVPAPATAVHALLDQVSVREQIALGDVAGIRSGGYRTLIDLRPDGEAADQPSSALIAEEAKRAGLAFAYHPTPHGDIPDNVANDLARTLAVAERPVLLYCRSGKRAARVWALAEASRPGGPDAMRIASAVRAAGQPVEDLMPAITARIATRVAQSKCTGGDSAC